MNWEQLLSNSGLEIAAATDNNDKLKYKSICHEVRLLSTIWACQWCIMPEMNNFECEQYIIRK